jgi:transcription factor WhiB
MKASGNFAWQKDSLCKREKKFVPETKEHVPYAYDDFYPPTGKAVTEEVKDMCNRCPVQKECLEFALERPEKYGFWGGMSEKERKEIRRKKRKQQVKGK